MYFPICIYLVLSYFFQPFVTAAKLRSWQGPDGFFDGVLPSSRQYFGFASYADLLFIHAGINIGMLWYIVLY